MTTVLRIMRDSYEDLMENKSDPRVRDWPMMSGPLPTALICIGYVYLVKVLGPKLMENRKPFDLRRVLIFYNLFEVLLSAWLFNEALAGGWWNDYSFRCQAVDYSNRPKAVRMAHGCWWYYMSKFVELFDTVFFVLRKKDNQITTLHVIHHGVMPLSTWFGVKFTPGGHSSFFGLLNTFVHIVMYSYYLLAALGPKVQPYLWWKKYLTSLQMIQFIFVMIHAFQLLFTDCDYPKAFVWWIGGHSFLFFFLFRDFYINAYTKKSNKQYAKSKKTAKYENNYTQDQSNNKKEAGTTVYPNQYKMATGYISDNGLRNRAFINNNNPVQ